MSDRRFFDSTESFEMESLAREEGDGLEHKSALNAEAGDIHLAQRQPIQFLNHEAKMSPAIVAMNVDQSTVETTGQTPAYYSSQLDFLKAMYAYLSRDKNWLDLLATSTNWMLLDFTFYLLGVNSTKVVPNLFGINDPNRSPYSLLIEGERHIIYSSSVGSLLGSIAAIALMRFRTSKSLLSRFNSPRKVQQWGFVILAGLFVIVGALYITLPTTHAYVAIVLFYQLCHLFFNLGQSIFPIFLEYCSDH